MPERVVEVVLVRRSRPDQLRYLAAKLREDPGSVVVVASVLDGIAAELEKPEPDCGG